MSPRTISAILACVTAAACGGTSVGSPAPAGTTPQTPAPKGDWSCVSLVTTDEARVRTEVSTPPASEAFDLYFVEAYYDIGLPGLTVTACPELDTACASPIATAKADDYGGATLSVPGGLPAFGGYLKITYPGMPDNYLFHAGASVAPGARSLDVVVYTAAASTLTYDQVGLPVDLQHGLVGVRAVDCSGAPASGVELSFETDHPGELVTAYFAGGGATLSRTATATDATGAAYLFDVPPGAIGVVGRLGGAPAVEGLGFAYAGAVTSVVVRPAE